MDALLPFACLILGIALPMGAVFLMVRRAWRQLGAAEAYREMGHRLGLPVDTRGLSLQGYLDRRPLWIGQVMQGHGTERQFSTRGLVGFSRPLGYGLLVRRRGMRRLFRMRSPEVRLGDEDLDKLFNVNSDAREAVRSLLTHPAVRSALLDLVASWPHVVLTDHAVRVMLKAPENTSADLEHLVRAMERVATALENTRQELPPPDRLEEHVPLFDTLATELGLTNERSLPALTGKIDGYDVLVCIRRQARGYAAAVRLWFGEHPELGLRVAPQTRPDGYWSVGQDIQFGDERFDDGFVVKGYNPGVVRERLDLPTRELLLSLQSRGDIDVDDHAISIRNLDIDAAVLRDTVREAAAMAVSLGW